jgi:prolyl oligopeptidase PreP (S9A serine peptidase family)
VADPASPQQWTTVLPEDDEAVLEDVELLDGDDGPLLAVLRTRHAVSELALHALDGTHLRDVALPGVGTVGGLSAPPEGGPHAWLGYTDATTPARVLRLDVRTAGLDTWAEPPGSVEVSGVHARVVETTSADGTTVRMQVLSPTASPDRPRPTVLYGYGGFGIALTPAYTASAPGLGAGRRHLGRREPARRHRGGRAVAPRRDARAQAERLRRLRGVRRRPGRRRAGRRPGSSACTAAATVGCWSAPR